MAIRRVQRDLARSANRPRNNCDIDDDPAELVVESPIRHGSRLGPRSGSPRTNLALGPSVTASNVYPGDPSRARGTMATGHVLECGQLSPQWIEVDLGAVEGVGRDRHRDHAASGLPDRPSPCSAGPRTSNRAHVLARRVQRATIVDSAELSRCSADDHHGSCATSVVATTTSCSGSGGARSSVLGPSS